MAGIEIRRMRGADAFQAAVEMQQLYWGDDARYLVPNHMLHSISRYGGHLLGAYDERRLVGILIGFVGCDGAPAAENLLIMSKRMLVLPAYRGRNIGFRLKLAQRDLAMEQGIRRVTWTFDPLLAPNAHLNLRKLGAVVKAFAANYIELEGYGEFDGDRFVANWHVNSRRANDFAAGAVKRMSLNDCLERGAELLNPETAAGDSELPVGDSVLVEIPAHVAALPREKARNWRRRFRDIVPPLFARGLIVSDFISEQVHNQRRGWYHFTRPVNLG